jgi:hypothetical protein
MFDLSIRWSSYQKTSKIFLSEVCNATNFFIDLTDRR